MFTQVIEFYLCMHNCHSFCMETKYLHHSPGQPNCQHNYNTLINEWCSNVSIINGTSCKGIQENFYLIVYFALYDHVFSFYSKHTVPSKDLPQQENGFIWKNFTITSGECFRAVNFCRNRWIAVKQSIIKLFLLRLWFTVNKKSVIDSCVWEKFFNHLCIYNYWLL